MGRSVKNVEVRIIRGISQIWEATTPKRMKTGVILSLSGLSVCLQSVDKDDQSVLPVVWTVLRDALLWLSTHHRHHASSSRPTTTATQRLL